MFRFKKVKKIWCEFSAHIVCCNWIERHIEYAYCTISDVQLHAQANLSKFQTFIVHQFGMEFSSDVTHFAILVFCFVVENI